MTTLDQRFMKHNDCVTRRIAGETIIVPIRSRVGDLESIYTLDELGTMIWNLLDGRADVSQIVQAVTSEYDVVAEEAEKDVVDFVDSLSAAGLIRPSSEHRD